MNTLDEAKNVERLRKLALRIKAASSRPWTIMELSSAHTESYLQYDLSQWLPESITICHGPGAAEYLVPVDFIDTAVQMACQPGTIVGGANPILHLPGTSKDLLDAKAEGADVRVVHSPLDCLAFAQAAPEQKVIYVAIGFESLAQQAAMAVWQARRLGLTNFYLHTFIARSSAAIPALLKNSQNGIDAFLGPGDLCQLTGTSEYDEIARQAGVPIVITGLEPADFLEGVLLAVEQLEARAAEVEIQDVRSVSRNGNGESQALVKEVFAVADCQWRIIGNVARGQMVLSAKFQNFNAETAIPLSTAADENLPEKDTSMCISADVLHGHKRPQECSAFGKACKPEHPIGATMMSPAGPCAAYLQYKQV